MSAPNNYFVYQTDRGSKFRDAWKFCEELDPQDMEPSLSKWRKLMSLYLDQPPNEDDEAVRLESWSIRQFDGGARHFVGFSLETYEGRVSTAITVLDVEARTARTASGRKYELVGPCGYNSDAEYVFNRVKEIIGGGQPWKDVSEQLIPGSRRPRQRIVWPEDEE